MASPIAYAYSDTLSAIIDALETEVSLLEGRALKDAAGLGVNEWRVLAALATGAQTAAEAASLSGVDKGWVSRSISSLTKKGLVTRKGSDFDRRAKSLAMTEEGVTAHNEAAQSLRDLQNKLLDAFSADEHQAFVRLTDRLLKEARTIADKERR